MGFIDNYGKAPITVLVPQFVQYEGEFLYRRDDYLLAAFKEITQLGRPLGNCPNNGRNPSVLTNVVPNLLV